MKLIALVSVVVLSGLVLVGCGKGIDGKWKTACGGSAVQTLDISGETATATKTVFHDVECREGKESVSQTAKVKMSDSGKTGVRDAVVLSFGSDSQYTVLSSDQKKAINTKLTNAQKEELNDLRGARDDEQRRALELANDKIREVKKLSSFEVDQAVKLNWKQQSKLETPVIAGVTSLTREAQYQMDGDVLTVFRADAGPDDTGTVYFRE